MLPSIHTHSDTNTQPLCPHFDGDLWMGPKHIIIFIVWFSQHWRQLQHTRHAGSLVPITLATSHSSADIPSSGPTFILLLGLFVHAHVCVRLFVCSHVLSRLESVCLGLYVGGSLWEPHNRRCIWSTVSKQVSSIPATATNNQPLKCYVFWPITLKFLVNFCRYFSFLCWAIDSPSPPE